MKTQILTLIFAALTITVFANNDNNVDMLTRADHGVLGNYTTYHSVEEIKGSTFTEFPGGKDAMLSYLGTNAMYCSEAYDKGEQAVVYVRFVVAKDGAISNAEIISSDDMELNECAIKIIENMPAWKPTVKNGTQVSTKVTLPLMFNK